MDGLSAERCLALRAEASWRSSLKLPEEPPWVYLKAATTLSERPKQGIVRRPQIYPPPLHIPTPPPSVEIAEQEPGASDFRRRLEERFKDDVSLRRDGYVVFDDTAAYSIPSNQNSQSGRTRDRAPVESNETPTLSFESRFESGNLRKAVQVGQREYDLSLRPDKDSGHVQWYYFMVGNVRSGVPYIFNIVNFVKQKSLYNQGLKPLLYSSMDAKNRKVGWQRSGSKCAYYSRSAKYTLTFTIQFENEGDTCFLAHCYPYTYTDLQLFLASLETNPDRRLLFTRRELCRSLADNRVDLITISEPGDDSEPRKAILLTARVHPGETQASWSMQGCIQFLTSGDPAAKLLRQRYAIYVVPMLNPDGVINGHYRCSLAGQDLNRLWADPDISRHPCIWHVKNLVRQLVQKGLVFFCDFHGHSTKRNAFMYGCEPSGRPGEGKPVQNPSTVFPSVLAELSPAFSLNDCDYRIQKNKVTTGRVVVAREFSIANSYTLEVSFLGHKVGPSLLHFNLEDLLQLGRRFGDAIVKYHLPTHYEAAATQRLAQPLSSDAAKCSSPSLILDEASAPCTDSQPARLEPAGDAMLAQASPASPKPQDDSAAEGDKGAADGGERVVERQGEGGGAAALLEDLASFSLSGWEADKSDHEMEAVSVSALSFHHDPAHVPAPIWPPPGLDQDPTEEQDGRAGESGKERDGEDSGSSSEHASVASDTEGGEEDGRGAAAAAPRPSLLPKVASRGASPDTEQQRRGSLLRLDPAHAAEHGGALHGVSSVGAYSPLGRSLRTGGLWPKGVSVDGDKERGGGQREGRGERSRSGSGAGEGPESVSKAQQSAGPDGERSVRGEAPRRLSSRGSLRAEGAEGEGELLPRYPAHGSAEPSLWKARSDGSLVRLQRQEERAEEVCRAASGGEAPWTLTASRRPAEEPRDKKELKDGKGGAASKFGHALKMQLRPSMSSSFKQAAAASAAARQPPSFPPRHFSSVPAHNRGKQRPEGSEPGRRDRAEAPAAAPASNAPAAAHREGGGGGIAGWWGDGIGAGVSRSWRQEKPRREEAGRHSYGAAPWGVVTNAPQLAPPAQGAALAPSGGLAGSLLGSAGGLPFPSVSLPSIVSREDVVGGLTLPGGGGHAAAGDKGSSSVARLLAMSMQHAHPRPLLHPADSDPGGAVLGRGKSGRQLEAEACAARSGAADRSGSPAPPRREERESPPVASGRALGREARALRGQPQAAPLTPGGSRSRVEHVSLPKPTLLFEYA